MGLETGKQGILSSCLYQVSFASLRKGLDPRTKAVQILSISLSLSLGLTLWQRLSWGPSISLASSLFPISSTQNPRRKELIGSAWVTCPIGCHLVWYIPHSYVWSITWVTDGCIWWVGPLPDVRNRLQWSLWPQKWAGLGFSSVVISVQWTLSEYLPDARLWSGPCWIYCPLIITLPHCMEFIGDYEVTRSPCWRSPTFLAVFLLTRTPVWKTEFLSRPPRHMGLYL